jgi:hypothetical protein
VVDNVHPLVLLVPCDAGVDRVLLEKYKLRFSIQVQTLLIMSILAGTVSPVFAGPSDFKLEAPFFEFIAKISEIFKILVFPFIFC